MDDSDHSDEVQHATILNSGDYCQQSRCAVRCICSDSSLCDGENSPLISYQSHGDSDNYLTDIHCHEARPIYSNRRAKRKLTIASVVCLLFVVAEVVGE